jgi:hypothetical protein
VNSPNLGTNANRAVDLSNRECTGEVLVIGGSGFYGRYLVEDLIQQTNANVIVASRRPREVFARHKRVSTVSCDLSDLGTLKQLASKSNIIVHCAGPFQYLPLNPLRAAIETCVNYVDISEDREFARQVVALESEIQSAGITVLNGISVAPAMEALFAELLRHELDSVLSVRTFAAPDTRKHRGKAMFHTMLSGVGRAFEQPRQGRPMRVYGWTEPEWVEFPPPLGKRLTYLVLEMADLDILPRIFGVQTVEFKAGTEHALLNRMLNWAAALRVRTGHPHWERYTSFIRALSWFAGRFGKDEGGVIFEISGERANSTITYRIAVMATRDGGRIPAVLASMAVKELLSGKLSRQGLVPVNTWISSEDLVEGLVRRGLEVWWQPHGKTDWRPISLAELGADLRECERVM